MSFATLERAILTAAQMELKNPRLKKSEILEWSTSEEGVRKNAGADEVVFYVVDPGVFIAVKQSHDRRGA
jgi:hypothetical protein